MTLSNRMFKYFFLIVLGIILAFGCETENPLPLQEKKLINILCDNALLIGYGLVKKKIDGEILGEAIADLSWSPYLDGSEPLDSVPIESQEPQSKEEQIPASSAGDDYDTPAEKVSFDLEKQIGDREEADAELEETTSPDREEKKFGFVKVLFNRRQSGMIAGILILACLILISWFLITKPKLNLGITISSQPESVEQTEVIDIVQDFFKNSSKK